MIIVTFQNKYVALKLGAIPKRDQVMWCIKYLGMQSKFVVVRFILQFCSGKEYKGMASSASAKSLRVTPTIYLATIYTTIIYIPPPVMVHTSRYYQYASYEEFRDNGMFSTEAYCMQFLYDMKILRTHRMCCSCNIPMTLTESSTTKYRNGCCWKRPCDRTTSPKKRLTGSGAETARQIFSKELPSLLYYRDFRTCFVDILSEFKLNLGI